MSVTNQIHSIPLKYIQPGQNDRTVFSPRSIGELAAAIRSAGRLIQPITVNQLAKNKFEIVAGERRFRAVKSLGWSRIDAIITKLTPEEASAIMLTENVSREDLDPIDEARAFQVRLDKFNWTIEELSQRAGCSIIYIRLRLKLLSLRLDLQDLVRSGNLTIGYAQILSDGGLDTNRQLFAVKALRENPRPTPGWFRGVVNQYAEQQNQISLFDTAFLVCQELPVKVETIDPPHPMTTIPPVLGTTPKEILSYQVSYWRLAADQWQAIGKPFKKQECEAAAQALDYIVNQFS